MGAKLSPYERRRLLYDRVREVGKLEIGTLAEEFRVSEMTIRRDVKEMESANMLRLDHGQVLARDMGIWELPVSSRLRVNTEEKRLIARAAVELLRPRMTVGLDGSTTCMYVAKAIEDTEELTVVTNNISLAAVVAPRSPADLIVIGGTARKDSLSMLGELAEQMIRQLNLDIFFMSGLGVHWEKGVTENHLLEVRVKQCFIASAKRVVVVADHTKMGQVALTTSCPVSRISTVVTDAGADPEALKSLSSVGIEIVVAGTD